MRIKATVVFLVGLLAFNFGPVGMHTAFSAEARLKSLSPRTLAATAENVITNGVPYETSLGSNSYGNAYIDVPEGATRLTITVSDGSGDLDLYVKYGAPLQGSTVAELDADTDFMSDGPTASEQVVVTPSDDPPLQAGKWYAAVLNYNAYQTSFTITATYEVPGTGLENGIPLNYALNGGRFLQDLYIDVPAEAKKLTIKLTDGQGDLALYVKHGSDVSGATLEELREDADFFSSTSGADETVVVDTTTSPPIASGKWYAAVGNPNDDSVNLTLTASYETVPDATPHQLTVEATPQRIVPGDPLDWTYSVTPGTVEGRVDLAAAIMLPWGDLMFLTENGLSYEPDVFRWGLDVEDLSTGVLFHELPFPSSVPEGQYGFYAVLLREGNPVPDASNWVSNVGGSLVQFNYRSPDHDWFLSQEGFPNGFVKSFSEHDGLVRVDETWVYAANGLTVSFVNGNFAGDEPMADSVTGTATPFRPENYPFDTGRGGIASRHGPAPISGQYSVWDGTLEVLVYDGIVFGLHNGRLVAVVAGPSTGTSADPADSASGESGPLPKLSKQGAPTFGRMSAEELNRLFSTNLQVQSLPSEDTAYLFSLASTLAAAALSGMPGAETAWNTCLAGFASQEPSEADVQCLKTALSSLVNAAASHASMGSESTSPQRRAGAYNHRVERGRKVEGFSNSLSSAGALDWLSAAWAGLTGHETTTGKSVNRSATRDGKTGCAGSVSPISVPAGGTANFRMDLYSRLRQQVGQAPIRGYGPSWDAYWEDRMSFIGQGEDLHWEYGKTVARDESTGPKEAMMYASTFVSSGAAEPVLEPADQGDLCTAAALFYLQSDSPTVTVTSDAAAIRVFNAGSFEACVHGGVPPFTLEWDLAGSKRTEVFGVRDIHSLVKVCRRADRIFTETGTYTVGVSLTDADGHYDYASVDVVVTDPELRLKFLQTTSEAYPGVGATWVVAASGGAVPYSYAYTFSDGVSGAASTFTRVFNTPGTRTVTVTATDSGSVPQTSSVSSSVWVRACEPPECCPQNPVPCGTVCLTSGATCCDSSTGVWCFGADCCPKPCVPPDCCAEYPQVCGPLCIPGGAKCCNPGTGGWCLSTEECCGAGCCEPDWYCCPDQAGCCRNGDVCCKGGGCCPAQAPQCCFPGCCPEESQCCGSGCCPTGYFCCPDKSGCCPDGYQCAEGGKCIPGSGGSVSRVFSANQFPKTKSGCLGEME